MKHWKNNDNTDDYRGFKIQIESYGATARDSNEKVVFEAESVEKLEELIDDLLDGGED